jgi:signal transduction histidine kinase
MDGFLNALLKLSRLGRRELQFEIIDVKHLVNETLKTLGHQIETKQVKIQVETLPQIYADRISLEQIFGNILTNAVNYLEPSRPGRVVINASRNTDEIVFSIQDNGRGIAESDNPKIFTPLRRAGAQDVPGEGMGLAYVQTLVGLHGGKLWFESQPNVGTTFFFSISNFLNGGTHND